MPVPLGQGIPLLPPGDLTTLDLVDQRILPDSGIAVLAYTVPGGEAAPKIGFIKPAKAAAKTRAALISAATDGRMLSISLGVGTEHNGL